jgi:hypothetical protein
MMNRQRGVSLGGLLLVFFVLIIVGIFGLKLIGPYMEFFKIKAAVEAIGSDRTKTASVGEVRKAFDARATIDDISSIKGTDLDVTKEGGDVVVAFAYRKEVPLFANIGLFVDFAGDSKPK